MIQNFLRICDFLAASLSILEFSRLSLRRTVDICHKKKTQPNKFQLLIQLFHFSVRYFSSVVHKNLITLKFQLSTLGFSIIPQRSTIAGSSDDMPTNSQASTSYFFQSDLFYQLTSAPLAMFSAMLITGHPHGSNRSVGIGQNPISSCQLNLHTFIYVYIHIDSDQQQPFQCLCNQWQDYLLSLLLPLSALKRSKVICQKRMKFFNCKQEVVSKSTFFYPFSTSHR